LGGAAALRYPGVSAFVRPIPTAARPATPAAHLHGPERRILNTLDPRSPLVLDVRELGRRAGSMREESLVRTAPEGIGIMSIGVPPGSDVELDLRLESVVEGVLVSGTARVQLTGECSRCLDVVSDELEVDIQELYVYEETDHRGRPVQTDSAEGDDEDDEQRHLVGDYLDLEPVLRDAVVLDLPLAPVCRDDCPGLCPQCGFRLEDDPKHDHDVIDPRWAALGTLTGDASTGTTALNIDDQQEED
jgi:uncharacterized protein